MVLIRELLKNEFTNIEKIIVFLRIIARRFFPEKVKNIVKSAVGKF